MNQPILQAKNLRKSFKHPALTQVLKDINLSVMPGETIAIMGRSGEGKSTLMHILGTLEAPCGGILEILGKDVNASNKTEIRNRNIGFIFQSFYLLEDCTALENVLMPARIARQPVGRGSKAYQRAQDLLEQVHLTHRAHFNVKLLSGGEKQRVAIARALCNDPDILLADEPSGNLDNQNSQHIQELLFKFVTQNKKVLIVVTHDSHLASQCSRQCLLHDGVLVDTRCSS